jgi:hypothetical protein
MEHSLTGFMTGLANQSALWFFLWIFLSWQGGCYACHKSQNKCSWQAKIQAFVMIPSQKSENILPKPDFQTSNYHFLAYYCY